jgi:hypothetical protein
MRKRIMGKVCESPVGSFILLCLLVLVPAAFCQAQPGPVVSWGNAPREWSNPVPGDRYVAVCTGGYHGLALTADGTLVAWGENANGQCNVPQGGDFTAIAAGLHHSLALRSDGSIIAWGDNSRRQCDVPGDRHFRALAAGSWHSVAIGSDGSLAAWGWNERGQCRVPPGSNYTSIAAGYSHSVALKADRSLIAWGSNGDGERDVPSGNDFVDIAAGSVHNLALRSNGTLVAWGRKSEGQCKVPPESDFVSVAAGSLHSLALKRDGSIVAWGGCGSTQDNMLLQEQCAVIAAGRLHNLAIRGRRAMPADVRVVETRTDTHTEAVKDAMAKASISQETAATSTRHAGEVSSKREEAASAQLSCSHPVTAMTDTHTGAVTDAMARASVSDETAGASTRHVADVNPKREKTPSVQPSHSHLSAAQVPNTASNSLNLNGLRAKGEGKAVRDSGHDRSGEVLSWVRLPASPVAMTLSVACGFSIVLGMLSHTCALPRTRMLLANLLFPVTRGGRRSRLLQRRLRLLHYDIIECKLHYGLWPGDVASLIEGHHWKDPWTPNKLLQVTYTVPTHELSDLKGEHMLVEYVRAGKQKFVLYADGHQETWRL